MNQKRCLTANSVKIGLTGKTKSEIIKEMVGIIIAANPNLEEEELLKAVFEREKQMSTGMNNGIAIPHGKTDAVKNLHVAIAVSKYPVEFESLDKKPARIFIMTISPKSQTGPHLQFLAEISRLLEKKEQRDKIFAVNSETELLQVFREGTA